MTLYNTKQKLHVQCIITVDVLCYDKPYKIRVRYINKNTNQAEINKLSESRYQILITQRYVS